MRAERRGIVIRVTLQGRPLWQRPLIVGASGQVGAELGRALEENGPIAVQRSGQQPREGYLPLDLGQLLKAEDAAVALGTAVPDLILCAGAMTFVDGCEGEPGRAFRVNAYGPAALAAYAHLRDIPLVYFSSDYVFDGSQEHPGPYNESADPCPLSVYGRSKLEGERAVLRVHPQALVVRTSWVYGPDPAGKNFISSLVRRLRAGERVQVPSDQVSTPTFNRDLARVTLALVASGATGIVHIAGPDLVSRLEVARVAARQFGLPDRLIDGVLTDSLDQRARRPLLSGLLSHRLHDFASTGTMHRLQEGLRATASDQVI